MADNKNRKQAIEEQSKELAQKLSKKREEPQETEEIQGNVVTDKETATEQKPQVPAKEKSSMTNKRIDFDRKTMKRLDMMLPAYSADAGEDIKESELYSYVVRVAVNALFEGDFKKKIDEL